MDASFYSPAQSPMSKSHSVGTGKGSIVQQHANSVTSLIPTNASPPTSTPSIASTSTASLSSLNSSSSRGLSPRTGLLARTLAKFSRSTLENTVKESSYEIKKGAYHYNILKELHLQPGRQKAEFEKLEGNIKQIENVYLKSLSTAKDEREKETLHNEFVGLANGIFESAIEREEGKLDSMGSTLKSLHGAFKLLQEAKRNFRYTAAKHEPKELKKAIDLRLSHLENKPKVLDEDPLSIVNRATIQEQIDTLRSV